MLKWPRYYYSNNTSTRVHPDWYESFNNVTSSVPVPVVVRYEEGGEEEKKTLDQDLVGLGFFNTECQSNTSCIFQERERAKTTT